MPSLPNIGAKQWAVTLNAYLTNLQSQINANGTSISSNSSSITTLTSSNATNTANIATLTTANNTNTTNIASNTSSISTLNSTTATNTSAISTIQGAWSTYTPSLINITLGNGTLNGRFRQVGKSVDVSIILTVGSTTSASGTLQFGLPFASRSPAVCNGTVLSQTSAPFTSGICYLPSTTVLQLQGSSGGFGASLMPLVGNTLNICFQYEAA